LFAPALHVGGWRRRGEAFGIRQHGGQQRGVAARQAHRGLAEEAPRGGLGTVGSEAKFRNVQVHLENSPLRPAGLDQHREVGFQTLAKVAAAGP